LIVEDDPDLRALIRRQLEAAGYEVWAAGSGEQALDLIRQRGLPHLALVDIVLPGIDGLSLARKLQEGADLPIVLLTAVSRIERVLRRIGDFAYTLEPVIRVDEWLSIDFAHQRVWVEGRPVALTSTESKLLHVLMRHGGRVVATDFLLSRLWPSEEVYEDTLRVHHERRRLRRSRAVLP
jgi:DNA-binding response OmpR family regulator